MRLTHSRAAISGRFDDPNLVSSVRDGRGWRRSSTPVDECSPSAATAASRRTFRSSRHPSGLRLDLVVLIQQDDAYANILGKRSVDRYAHCKASSSRPDSVQYAEAYGAGTRISATDDSSRSCTRLTARAAFISSRRRCTIPTTCPRPSR
jgi:hypothetical protein